MATKDATLALLPGAAANTVDLLAKLAEEKQLDQVR